MTDNHFTIQWAVGLFEGEGCISINPPRRGEKYQCITLRLDMTDEDVINTFKEVVDCGTVRFVARKKPHWKDVYVWGVSDKPTVYKLLLRMRRHLHSRRQIKCDEAIAILQQDKRILDIMS